MTSKESKPGSGRSKQATSGGTGGGKPFKKVVLLVSCLVVILAVSVALGPNKLTTFIQVWSAKDPQLFPDSCISPLFARARSLKLEDILRSGKGNDGYCDCVTLDGRTDEPGSACAENVWDRLIDQNVQRSRTLAAIRQSPTFECVKDPPSTRFIPVSQVLDGIIDCCDGSDEEGSPLRPAVAAATGKGQVRPTCGDRWKAETASLDESIRVAKEGNTVYRSRSQAGKATWYPKFLKQYQTQSAQLQKRTKKFRARINELQNSDAEPTPQELAELRQEDASLVQLGQSVTEGEWLLGLAGKNVASLREQWEKNQSQQANQPSSGGRSGPVAKDPRLELSIFNPLGAYHELHPLVGKCYQLVRHELEFRGGSPEPDEFHFLFEFCPFKNVTQRRATPDEIAALTQRNALKEGEKATAGQLGNGRSVVGPTLSPEVIQSLVNQEPAAAGHGSKGKSAAEIEKTYKRTVLGFFTSVRDQVSNLSYAGRPDGSTIFRGGRRWHRTTRDELLGFNEGENSEPKGALPATTTVTAAGPNSPCTISYRDALQSTTSHGSIPIPGVSLYSGGDACWEGPPRTVRVVFVCHSRDELLDVYEDGKCTYEMTFGTPSRCTDRLLSCLTSWRTALQP
jgi:hypothetical protein